MPNMFHPRPGESTDGAVDVHTATGDLRDASLWDFDIDDDTLKPAHTRYLDDLLTFLGNGLAARMATVKPGQKAWTASIDGFASHTGSAQHNEYLSAMREQMVENYLRNQLDAGRYRALLPNLEFSRKFHGYRDSPAAGENARYRSVRVAVHRPGLPPPPIDIVPAGPQRWKIRLYRGAGASIIIFQGDAIVVQILDLKRNLCGVYYYIGGGLSIPSGKITLPPGSLSGVGAFTDFTTSHDVTLSDFEGEASLMQSPGAAIGSHSVGGTMYLALQARPLLALPGTRKTIVSPDPIPVGGGSGFGIGLGSSSTGKLSKPVIFEKCCGGVAGGCPFSS